MAFHRARLNETLARLERVVTALDAGKENVEVNARTESLTPGRGNKTPEQAAAAESLLFQKQVADSMLAGKVL